MSRITVRAALAALVLSASVSAVTATQASAAIFKGSVKDRAGDGPSPSRDLISASASYDNAKGKLDFAVRLGAAPGSATTQIAAGVGYRTASGLCSVPLLVVGANMPGGQAVWGRENTGEAPIDASGPARITINGARINLSAQAADLRGVPRPNCAEVSLASPDDATVIYDSTGTFGINPPPRRARLSVAVNGAKTVKRGGRTKLRVKVRNRGNKAATKVRLRLKANGPGSVKPRSRMIRRIAPGKAAQAAFTLRAGGKAKGRIKVAARLTAPGGHKAGAAKVVRVKVPAPRRKARSSGGLAGKLFWGFESYQWNRSSDILGLYFANSRFVHWGIPKGGLRNCGRVTARVKDGEMQPGCLRYSYNKRNGRVKIGKAKGTFRNGELKMKMDDDLWRTDGEQWYPTGFAKAGTRFNLSVLHRGYSGACGISPSCVTWKEIVTLERGGRFGRTRSSLSTSGGGALPFISIASFPPEDRGRYRVLGNGRIRFSYADGKVSTETLVLQTNKKGRPDPGREGILLDDVWFNRNED